MGNWQGRYLWTVVYLLAFVGEVLAGVEEKKPPETITQFILGIPAHYLMLLLLLVLVIASLGGHNLGAFCRGLLKKGDDHEVTVNINEPKPLDKQCPVVAAGGLPINPELCMAHKAEHERSIRNQENIGKIFKELGALREGFHSGFTQISQEIGTTKTEIIKALAGKK